MKIIASAALAIALLFGPISPGYAATELRLWHSQTGANNEIIETLARDFNASQSGYRLVPVYKGTYPETLQAGIAAYRAGEAPQIIQVFDVGTGVMMKAQDAFVPVADIFARSGISFDKERFLPGIRAYYSRPDGTMLSFPYNSSSPILYYNKEAFRKAGLDAERPPLTWPDVWKAARRITGSGAASCGYTTTWLTWIHLENFAAWNDLPYASNQNGLAGDDMELKTNAPIFVRHMDEIADLAREGVFRYGGRTSEAKALFFSGECAILTESSGGLGDVVKSGIDFGTGPLPYEPRAPGAPQNTVPGGASLWVLAGHTDADYAGVATFLEYLSTTPVQSRLHQVSGYLPATLAAYEATKASGFYMRNPGREQPILQMMGRRPTANSRGVRSSVLPQLRDIQNEEFEDMLAGQQSAQQALDRAVERGNAAIGEEFGR